MTYQISATKIQSYHRCPYAYYLRYERKVSSNAFFGSASLGTALHQALAQCHRDWHYQSAHPDLNWVHHCWEQQSSGLTSTQITEGREILENYYQQFIANQSALARPLAVEGKIHAFWQVESLEFCITGRYDRLDFLQDGLELIDYKSSRERRLPTTAEIDLQIGLYYLALEQVYRQSLNYLSLLFLRVGEKVQYEASPEQKELVQSVISDLAVRLRYDRNWEPKPGNQCDRCTYARYCPAVTNSPLPIPCQTKQTPSESLQLALTL